MEKSQTQSTHNPSRIVANESGDKPEMVEHKKKVLKIQERIKSYLNTNNTQKVIFTHGSSNSTRYSDNSQSYNIDLSELDSILSIDIENKCIVVEPNISMDKLIAFTLKYNLIPPVVPEFPGITVGGAVQGGSGESSSLKYGEFHNSCFEYEMILGNGELVTVSATENTDLFYGTDSSYGSMGIMTRISISLIPSHPYVELTYYPIHSFESMVSELANYSRKKVEYLDAIVYSPDRGIIMVGRGVDYCPQTPVTFLESTDPWFAQHVDHISGKGMVHTEYIPITDYIFRYDRGAYWMGDYFFEYTHLPNIKLLRWMLNSLFDTRTLFLGLQKGRLAKEFFIQDICFPVEHTVEFLEFLHASMGIYPLWICPLKPAHSQQFLCSHSQDTELVLNVGIWGRTKKYLADPMQKNRDVEMFSNRFGARKVLYAHQYYTPEEFWSLYDREKYNALREKYHASNMFPDVYTVTHVSTFLEKENWAGLIAVLKHIVRKAFG